MRNYFKKTKLVLSLEKDDKRNPTGMQFRAWKLDNGTTVLVRLFKHSEEAIKTLWDGKRTGLDVDNLILEFLQSAEVIADKENWHCSPEDSLIVQ